MKLTYTMVVNTHTNIEKNTDRLLHTMWRDAVLYLDHTDVIGYIFIQGDQLEYTRHTVCYKIQYFIDEMNLPWFMLMYELWNS